MGFAGDKVKGEVCDLESGGRCILFRQWVTFQSHLPSNLRSMPRLSQVPSERSTDAGEIIQWMGAYNVSVPL